MDQEGSQGGEKTSVRARLTAAVDVRNDPVRGSLVVVRGSLLVVVALSALVEGGASASSLRDTVFGHLPATVVAAAAAALLTLAASLATSVLYKLIHERRSLRDARPSPALNSLAASLARQRRALVGGLAPRGNQRRDG
jgi:hypothetical protein